MKQKHLLLLMAGFWTSGLISCRDAGDTQQITTTAADTAVLLKHKDMSPEEKAATNWERLNWNMPVVRYDELSSPGAEVRGNETYGIYSLGENVLFESGSAAIRSDAEANLKEIAASINQRYNGGEIRVYGYTDSVASEAANNQLSAARAAAVRDYLSRSGSIPVNRISVFAEGEHSPVADNQTEAGRRQNRRVEIVAMRTQ